MHVKMPLIPDFDVLLNCNNLVHTLSNKPFINELPLSFLLDNASAFINGHSSTYYTKILITIQQAVNWHLLYYNNPAFPFV
jgi:hypothetical protein